MTMLGGASLLDIIVLIWAIISFILYVCILNLLRKNRSVEPFSGSFFSLFTSIGVSDLCLSLHGYVTHMTRTWGWINWAPLYFHPKPTLASFFRIVPRSGSYFFAWSSYIGVLSIGLNRFAQLICPHKWTSSTTRTAIIVQWLLPALFVAPRLFQEHVVSERNVSGVTFLKAGIADKTFARIYNLGVGVVFTTVVNVCVTVLYIRMFLHVRKTKRDFGLTEENEVLKAEIRLAVMGFCLLVLMGSLEVFGLIEVVIDRNHSISVGRLIDPLMVVFGLSNPWLLLFCSTATRDKFKSSLGWLPTAIEPVQPKS